MASSKEGNPEKQSSGHAWQAAWRTSPGNNQETNAQRSLGARLRTTSNKQQADTQGHQSRKHPWKPSSRHSCPAVKRTSLENNQASTHEHRANEHSWEPIKRTSMAGSKVDNAGKQSSEHSCAPSKQTSLRTNQADIHGKQTRGQHSCATVKRDNQAIPGKQSVNLC